MAGLFKGLKRLRVPSSEEGSRLDRYLKREFPVIAVSLLHRLARTGKLHVVRDLELTNTSRKQNASQKSFKANCNYRLRANDTVLFPKDLADIAISRAAEKKEPRKVVMTEPPWFQKDTILYEDDNFIVLNKPPSVASQPGTGIAEEVSSALSYLQRDRPEPPRMVHRLDRLTSGVMVLARDLPSCRYISQLLRERDRVKKTYWALVVGVPERKEGRIKSFVDGKQAISEYRTIRSVTDVLTWLELHPITGRKRQLRIQCAEVLRCPILGDTLYPSKQGDDLMTLVQGPIRRSRKAPCDEQQSPTTKLIYLHAREIEFDAPDNSVIQVTAPVPPAFQKALRALAIDKYLEDPLPQRLEKRDKRLKRQVRKFIGHKHHQPKARPTNSPSATSERRFRQASPPATVPFTHKSSSRYSHYDTSSEPMRLLRRRSSRES